MKILYFIFCPGYHGTYDNESKWLWLCLCVINAKGCIFIVLSLGCDESRECDTEMSDIGDTELSSGVARAPPHQYKPEHQPCNKCWPASVHRTQKDV